MLGIDITVGEQVERSPLGGLPLSVAGPLLDSTVSRGDRRYFRVMASRGAA
jgi:hypothetical protein